MVEVIYYAMNHTSQHWHDPFAFRPERWLNKIVKEIGEVPDTVTAEKDADGDRLEAMQSFSVGPRNCIGRKYVFNPPYSTLTEFC
jgi:cytochrome P450